MDYLIVGLVAFFASGLTLYSGFGLGTVLLPAFAIFFPVPVAVAATGIVHLLNNFFKGGLLRHQVDWRTVARFGLPAIPAAVLGAWLLVELGGTPRLFAWEALGRTFGPTAAGVTIGVLMILFAVRRQNIWRNSRRRLAECRPRLGVDVRRRACGAASADVRWSVA